MHWIMLVLLLFLIFSIPKEKYYTTPSRQYVMAPQHDVEYQLQNPYYGRVHSVFKYDSPSEWQQCNP